MPFTLRPPTWCLVALLCVATSAAAQQGSAPAPAAAPAADSTADTVLESSRSRIAFDAEGTQTADHSVSMRVLTPSGVQQVGTVRIAFRKADGATLRVDYVRVRKPGGAVVETPLTQVFELPAPITQAAPTYSDIYVRHINVQALQPGDVLEYGWQIVDRSLISGHFWHSENIDGAFVGKQNELELSWPSTVRPIVKSPNHKPEVTNNGGRTNYRWTTTRLDATADESDDDADDAEVPDVQVTSFRDWSEIGTAVRVLWRGRAEVTPDVRAKALELTAGAMTDDAKARALYRHVATNIRYVAVAVGLGRIQPNTASTVLTNGFGDCKDKHILLEALLRAVGIEATPVLIGPGAELDPDVPSIAAFSHVITLIEQGATGPVWLDTTLEVAPFGSLVSTEHDTQALAIPLSGDPRLVTTPATTGRSSVWRTETAGTVTPEGQLQARVTEIVSGDFEVLLRSIFRAAGRQSWQQLVSSFPLTKSRGGTVSDIVVSAPEDTDAPFRVEYRYTLDSFVDWGKGTLWAPVAMDLTNLVVPDGNEKANLGTVAQLVAVSRLELPEGVDVEKSSSPPVDVEHRVARYHFTWSASGRVIETERRFDAIVPTLPADERDSYGAFIKTVRAAPYSLRVRRATPWAWNDGLTVDWYENTSAATSKALGEAAAIGRRGDHQELSHDPVIARHLVSIYQGLGDDDSAARYTALASVGGPLILIRGDVVNGAPPNTGVADARNTIDRMLAVALPAGLVQQTPVEVVLLVATGGRVLDVRFVGTPGEALPGALRSLVIPWMAPDGQLTQVIRRGTVSCDRQGACALRLWSSGSAAAGLPW